MLLSSENQTALEQATPTEPVKDGSDQTDFRAILQPEELPEIIALIEESPMVAIDTETTGLDYIRDQLHGVSLATADHEWYICDTALPYLLKHLVRITQEHPDILWLGHNLKFDLHFLSPYGFRPARIADTLIAQWLVNENLELGLKSLAHTRLGKPEDLPEYKDLLKSAKARMGVKRMEYVTIYDIPVHLLGEYSARDTRLTYDLWQVLVCDLDTEGMTDIFWNIEMPFVWVLLKMECRGMYINQAGLAEFDAELKRLMEEARTKWETMAPGVNQDSTKQLAELSFTKMGLPIQGYTKKGAPSTDDLTMMRLERIDTTGTIKALRDLRKYQKLMNTYVVMMQEKGYNGRLYGSFNQTGTVTGRLSSSNPNLQNIPARSEMGKKIRKLFGAAPGYVLVVCDYSQIELRKLADESQEENFLEVFRTGGDPHQLTADRAKVERYVGKTINFSWAYGAGPRKVADTIEKDGNPRPDEADTKTWLNQFDAAYPGLVNYKMAVIKRARQLGYVPTVGGRKRRLPDLNSPIKSLRSAAERQCINARIQGSCADMIKWAMLQLDAWCEMYGAYMIAQVHDELVFEVPEAVANEFMVVVQDTMESIQTKFAMTVSIEAKPGTGNNWGDAKH